MERYIHTNAVFRRSMLAAHSKRVVPGPLAVFVNERYMLCDKSHPNERIRSSPLQYKNVSIQVVSSGRRLASRLREPLSESHAKLR